MKCMVFDDDAYTHCDVCGKCFLKDVFDGHPCVRELNRVKEEDEKEEEGEEEEEEEGEEEKEKEEKEEPDTIDGQEKKKEEGNCVHFVDNQIIVISEDQVDRVKDQGWLNLCYSWLCSVISQLSCFNVCRLK